MLTIVLGLLLIPLVVSLSKSVSSPSSRSSKLLLVLLVLHTLSALHNLLRRPPPNIFTALRIPLNTPTDVLRALVVRSTPDADLQEDVDVLLKRLGSFDLRALYVRFGHNVLATCTYCHSYTDYMLYALPRPLLSYVHEIAFVGLLTLPRSPRAHLRPLAVSFLVLLGVAEAYWLVTVTISIPPRGSEEQVVMWHDTLLTLRHVAFLILPPLLHILPSLPFRFLRSPSSALPPNSNTSTKTPQDLLSQTHTVLTHLLPALHLLKYTYAAIARAPTLQERAGRWWEEEWRVGEWIRGGGDRHGEGKGCNRESPSAVRRVARGLGLGFDEGQAGGDGDGPLRASAKIAIDALWKEGGGPSRSWAVPE